MDNRSVVASSAEGPVTHVSAWETWSREVGFMSRDKAQLTSV